MIKNPCNRRIRGIGRQIVQRFRTAGGQVTVADLDVAALEADAHLPGDLLMPTMPMACLLLRQRCLVDWIFLLITLASSNVAQLLKQRMLIGIWLWGVNVEAPFRISRAAIPLMAKSGGGVIINVASCWGLRPGPNHALYCMTKAALASLTQCMGMDHAHLGIRVNAVCPNEVNTPMLRSGFEKRGFDPNDAIAELARTVPLGRIAEPDDITEVVLFLASDAARYLCGSLIEVNGGKPVQ